MTALRHFATSMRQSPGVWPALFLVCVFTSGCAREESGGIVRGSVTYKNAKLDKGTVVFHPAGGGGQMSHGNIRADGTFKLENQLKGELIQPGQYIAVVFADNTSIAAMKEDPSFPVQPTVPFKFSSVSTSPLKCEVVVGENNFDLNLDNTKNSK